MRKIDVIEKETIALLENRKKEMDSFVNGVIHGNEFSGQIYDNQDDIMNIMSTYKIELIVLKKIKNSIDSIKQCDMRRKIVKDVILNIEESIDMIR